MPVKNSSINVVNFTSSLINDYKNACNCHLFEYLLSKPHEKVVWEGLVTNTTQEFWRVLHSINSLKMATHLSLHIYLLKYFSKATRRPTYELYLCSIVVNVMDNFYHYKIDVTLSFLKYSQKITPKGIYPQIAKNGQKWQFLLLNSLRKNQNFHF